jgi:hypothetical protein
VPEIALHLRMSEQQVQKLVDCLSLLVRSAFYAPVAALNGHTLDDLASRLR